MTRRNDSPVAKQALVDTGYFTPEQVGDDIGPRIRRVGSATTWSNAHGDAGASYQNWKDRAITAERKLKHLKQAIADA